MKEKISLVTKGGLGNERRTTLRAELDELRSQQSGNKASRGKIFEQMKTLQEGIQKKVSTNIYPSSCAYIDPFRLRTFSPPEAKHNSKLLKKSTHISGMITPAFLFHVTCPEHLILQES